MAQSMVVVNGMILTLTAFFTISIFVQEALHDEYGTYNDLIKTEISNVFYSLDTSLADYVAHPEQSSKGAAFQSVFILSPDSNIPGTRIKGDEKAFSQIEVFNDVIKSKPQSVLLYTDGPIFQVRSEEFYNIGMRLFAIISP